jgi:hypothetical protein
MVTDWCESEVELYKKGNQGKDREKWNYVSGAGHFTQVVWKETQKVGAGYVRLKFGNSNYVLFVCNYSPSGNYMGQFSKNVTC